MRFPERLRGFWWRPGRDTTEAELGRLIALGTTDVAVWAEPFIDEQDRWHRLRESVQASGIRFHTWITCNHHYRPSLIDQIRRHPEWVAVDYLGRDTVSHPLAGRQIWPCPANPVRWEAEWAVWRPLVEGADGLHLDYIRYPDGFRFGEHPAIGRSEVAEQSYCYCAACKKRFLEETGLDATTVAIDPRDPAFQAWQRWRQDRSSSRCGGTGTA